jgi:arylsulfatase A-like enzyme
MRRVCTNCGTFIVAGLVAALVHSGCERPEPERSARPNILLLTVDTLRADHLRGYGYHRDTMPAIEAFADTAAIFEAAVVPRGTTRPSYASMLTGMYPFRHGVRSNETRLHEDLETLPEALKKLGYHTAGFVSNFVLVGELSGFDQGFDLYDDFVQEREGAGRTNYERTAANTIGAIMEWLEAGPPEPFFLFVNLIDPHGPYHPPQRYRQLYRSDEVRLLDRRAIPDYQFLEGSLDFHDYVDRYDAEIRYADEALGVLIDELKRTKLWDDALVIFTADHGESLGEHEIYFEHSAYTWEETVRVPLMIRLPGQRLLGAAGPRRLEGLCSPMDLTPTILDLVDAPARAAGDGASLLPVLRGAPPGPRYLLLEFPSEEAPKREEPDVYSVRSDDAKLTRARDPRTKRTLQQVVTNLDADPLETAVASYDPRLPQHARLAAELDRLLAELDSYELPFRVTVYKMPFEERTAFVDEHRRVNERTLSPEQVERLRSLGYLR